MLMRSVTLERPRFTAPTFVRHPSRAMLRTPWATALMPSLAKSCRPAQTPGIVCPYVPLCTLLYVFVVTRNDRDNTSFGTFGLSSANVATSSAPDPLLMPNRSSRMLSDSTVPFAGTSKVFSIAVPPPVGRNVTLTVSG